jgi:capsular polysaccharide export protein
VRTHVLEEGYIRPNWMTLEPDGVNARSTLSRNKRWFRKEAAQLPPVDDDAPITAAFKRRARDAYWYYHHVVTGRLRYPHYHSHRPGSIVVEGLGWLWKFAWEKPVKRRTERVLADLADRPFFVFPLQLSGDYQIRAHSPFRDMQSAATYVIESFARRAPAGVDLLLKRHPLDNSFFNWERFVRRLERQFGISGRVHLIDGGDLDDLAARARGLVCVNSTSATLALEAGTPVCAIGEAIYDIDGLTHQAHLDSFWLSARPPEAGLYADFKRVLVDRCLVRGGLASESAVEVLVRSMSERLLAPEPKALQAPLTLVPSAVDEVVLRRG